MPYIYEKLKLTSPEEIPIKCLLRMETILIWDKKHLHWVISEKSVELLLKINFKCKSSQINK